MTFGTVHSSVQARIQDFRRGLISDRMWGLGALPLLVHAWEDQLVRRSEGEDPLKVKSSSLSATKIEANLPHSC